MRLLADITRPPSTCYHPLAELHSCNFRILSLCRRIEVNLPYTPILNIAHILQSTLHLIENTEYPHKGSPALEHVKKALRDALDAIHEVEQLQALAVQEQQARQNKPPDKRP